MPDDGEFADPAEKLVLIVDDDESVLDLIQTLVRAEGFRVERALDGLQALERTRSLQPDLIVLDLMLPGKNGYEVVRDLQAEGAGDIPVIVATGRAIDRKISELLKAESNVRDVIAKPLHRLFTTRVHALLGTRPRQPL